MFTLQDVLLGNKGTLALSGFPANNDEMRFFSAQHDSRTCQAHDLFVAIVGEHVDGHRFIPELARAGIRAALCTVPQKDVPAAFLQLIVPDVIQALQATARVRVQRQPDTIRIGITGSSGKTTTKEAIAAVLSRSTPVLKTFASYNNELGYPLTLLRLEDEQRFAVLEMGAERVGELRSLCERVVRPDWSVITTIGTAHLKHFGSVDNIVRAKSELVQVLSHDGFAFLNEDDPRVRSMKEQTHAQVISYGQGEAADVRALHVEDGGVFGSRFRLRAGDHEIPVKIHLPGQHGITTALAAASVGYVAGLSLEMVRDALEEIVPVEGRGQVLMGAGPAGSTVINDTYNAIRQAIVAIAQAVRATPLSPHARRWAILGELLEQGEHSREEHVLAGKALVGAFDYVITLGDFARYYCEGAIEAGMPAHRITYFSADPAKSIEVEKRKQDIADFLKQHVRTEDILLVKGSRGMQMETLLPLLKEGK